MASGAKLPAGTHAATERQHAICTQLRAAREHADLTARQLARTLDLSPAMVSNYELGRRHMNVDRVGDWCDACGLSMAEFFAGVDGDRGGALADARRLAGDLAAALNRAG